MRNGQIKPDSPFGVELGFTSDKFNGWLWLDEDRVMISYIESREQGRGHLSALFNAIEARALRVAVPTPFRNMKSILKKKGFIPHFEQTDDLGPVEVWEKPIP